MLVFCLPSEAGAQHVLHPLLFLLSLPAAEFAGLRQCGKGGKGSAAMGQHQLGEMGLSETTGAQMGEQGVAVGSVQ